MDTEPVDGFTVDHDDRRVILVLTSRYGDGERYYFPAGDAMAIGKALIAVASELPAK